MAVYSPTGLARDPEDMITLRDRDNRALQDILAGIPRQTAQVITLVSGAAAVRQRHPYPGITPCIVMQPVGAGLTANLVSVDETFYEATVTGGVGTQSVHVTFIDCS